MQQAVQPGQAQQCPPQGNQRAFETKRISNPQRLGTIVIRHRAFLKRKTIGCNPHASPTSVGPACRLEPLERFDPLIEALHQARGALWFLQRHFQIAKAHTLLGLTDHPKTIALTIQ